MILYKDYFFFFNFSSDCTLNANWPLKLLCLGLSSRSGLTLSRENSSCQSPFTHWSPMVENERFISLLSEDACCTCAIHKYIQKTNRRSIKSTKAHTDQQTATHKHKYYTLFETVHTLHYIRLHDVNEMGFDKHVFWARF